MASLHDHQWPVYVRKTVGEYPVNNNGIKHTWNDFEHERRCVRFVQKLGRRCRRWALIGSEFCQFHGGKRSARREVRLAHLPGFYSKHLTKTLASFIDDALGEAPSKQMSVLEELAMMRHPALQVVKLYDAVTERLTTETDPKKKEALLSSWHMIAANMQESLKEVVKVAESAARIDAMAKDKVSVHSVGYVVNQLVRLMHDVCHEDHEEIAIEFERRAREEIRLPSAGGSAGTALTPDMTDEDVMEMDETVPGESEGRDDAQH